MDDEEVRRVHINNCVRDSELVEADALVAAADPGEWRHVMRYGAKPLERLDGSLALMAASVRLVPRLVRGIRALEEALRSAWITDTRYRREREEMIKRHEEAMVRANAHESGPDHEIDVMVRATELGCMRPGLLRLMLRKWAMGESIQMDPKLRMNVDDAEKRIVAEKKISDEVWADMDRERLEIHEIVKILRLRKKEKEAILAQAKATVAEQMGGR